MKSKKSTKKPTRRNSYKYAALEKSVNLKSRQSEIEDIQSYAKQIPDEMMDVVLADGTVKKMNPKEWLNNFTEEFVHADFQHDGEIIHKSKRLKKSCDDKNNERNRCIYTRESSKGMLKMVERIDEFEKLEIGEFSKPVKTKRKKD